MIDEYNIRQVIVIRRDLDMPPLKLAAQAAHASLGATLKNLDHPRVKEWLAGRFTKIGLYVDSEDELKEVLQKAKDANLINCEIIDSGKTVFDGVPTLTCIAIGPATKDELKPVTGRLKSK